jgi:hypothetical protein
MNYNQDSVVATHDVLSRAEGPVSKASTSGLSPSC